ncbi:retropepsin-like aspartic protease family protein [Chitinolyticbacter meiyuanensis]|uniref:retropepsin-like aspartic protease family protein n=1 Tax=Chitinolyticbacter meiyuanensis TaxID=682798 RepID=UPI0011E5B4E5|nr:retropepsin-like aspartic protease [Chitinolyticbacter meiyuanensis]
MRSSLGPLLVWLVVFGGVFVAMQQFIAAREAPGMAVSASNGHELSIPRSPDGHYRLRGEINGQPVVLMIDTGASSITLPAPLAESLNLPRGESITSYTANGTVRGYETELARLAFGGFQFERVRAGVVPNMPGGEILLGMNVLGRLEVVMRGERMILRLPAD